MIADPPTSPPSPEDDCDRLEELLDLLPSGVFFIDARCRITRWNNKMEEITGFGADEVLGQHCSVMEGDRCFADFSGAIGDESGDCTLFKACSLQGRRCRIRRKDGSWLNVIKNAQLFYDERGEVTGGAETVTDLTELLGLEEELAKLRRRRRQEGVGPPGFHGYVGRHPSMQRLYDLLATAGPSDSAVLIQGETGSGKGIAAQAIHEMSPRRKRPFVRVSCTALSESLLESELFGHVRGAFTGAVAGRAGRFEAADGGTLFLDEIGDVSPRVQTKLLRVLEELEFERVGSNRPIQVDIRVVAATHRDLRAMCDEGSFRPDLYYRLAVFPIRIPPLRERREDIPLLASHFLRRIRGSGSSAEVGIEPEALELLLRYSWPGNVRELLHALEYGAILSGDGPIGWTSLPPAIQAAAARRERAAMPAAPAAPPSPARRHLRPSREEVLVALEACGGRRTASAERLGVSRMTLWKWMRELDIAWPPIA